VARTVSGQIRKTLYGGKPQIQTDQAVRQPRATWVDPVFIADVEYRDITSEGLLRQRSFKGLKRELGARNGVLNSGGLIQRSPTARGMPASFGAGAARSHRVVRAHNSKLLFRVALRAQPSNAAIAIHPVISISFVLQTADFPCIGPRVFSRNTPIFLRVSDDFECHFCFCHGLLCMFLGKMGTCPTGSRSAADSWIPTCSKQQEHGVVAFELRFYTPVFKTVCDQFAVEADLPLPPGRPVGFH
jgi:hypothetical protein